MAEPDPSVPPSQPGVSRRSFVQSLGLSAAAGAISTRLDTAARGQDQREAVEPDGGPKLLGPDPFEIKLTINGRPVATTIDPATTLMEALRWQLSLTGTKEVCDRGACGGCSVLVDGKLTVSCMMLAIDAVGTDITTIEGLASGGEMHAVQQAFVRHDALQCGFCTPGLVMAVTSVIQKHGKPTLDQIKAGLAGNICRCGTYTNVFNAALEASGQAPLSDPKAS
jgi:aerobic-type carbon monoxide dehydrogenase small subunit (CoxS/CutS family)